MKERIWTPEQLERKREGMRRLRIERKEWGVCANCGAPLDLENRLTCSKCIYRKTLSRIKSESSEMPDHKAERLKKMRERKATLRAYRRENHLCLLCGKPAYKNLTRCYECSIRDNRWAREKRKRDNITRIPATRPLKPFAPLKPSPDHPWRIMNLKTFGKGKTV